MSYKVFTRTWWKRNPKWPEGREPKRGRKTVLGMVRTEEEAVRMCDKYNDTHKPGFLSRKAEFEEV